MVVSDTYPTTESPPGDRPAVACPACGHPSAEHDRISARYCAATTVGHHDRGCVCTVRTSVGTDDQTAPKAN
jgi:hypothetical protein